MAVLAMAGLVALGAGGATAKPLPHYKTTVLVFIQSPVDGKTRFLGSVQSKHHPCELRKVTIKNIPAGETITSDKSGPKQKAGNLFTAQFKTPKVPESEIQAIEGVKAVVAKRKLKRHGKLVGICNATSQTRLIP